MINTITCSKHIFKSKAELKSGAFFRERTCSELFVINFIDFLLSSKFAFKSNQIIDNHYFKILI